MVCKHDNRQIKKCYVKYMEWDIENMIMITIKNLEIDQIFTLNIPQEVDIPLNKYSQTSTQFVKKRQKFRLKKDSGL